MTNQYNIFKPALKPPTGTLSKTYQLTLTSTRTLSLNIYRSVLIHVYPLGLLSVTQIRNRGLTKISEIRCKLDKQFQEQDSRRLWHGLQAITSYKGGMKCNNSDPNLPDNLNEFYARFDRANTNTLTHMNIQTDNNITLAFTEPEVRKIFRKTHARKAAGPDGIPSRVVKMCASQISGIFTDIFNQFLRHCIIPKCFKQSTIIPVPKKSSVSCLNDYRPVALTSVIMK